jgi:hypothetical protein
MIKDESLGLEIAETPREALIKETIDATKKKILELDLTLELQKQGLEYLEKQIVN